METLTVRKLKKNIAAAILFFVSVVFVTAPVFVSAARLSGTYKNDCKTADQACADQGATFDGAYANCDNQKCKDDVDSAWNTWLNSHNKPSTSGVVGIGGGTPSGATGGNTTYVPLESSVTSGQSVANFGDYLKRVYEIGITVTIVLAVLYLVIGGFNYITSAASLTGKEHSKTMINNALFGLALALLSYIILNTISPRFTQFSLNISEVGKSFNTVVPAIGTGGTVGVGGISVTKVPIKDGVCPKNDVCKASPEFVERAQKFVAIVGKDAGQFTEIGSYSYQGHSAECHKASPPTCGDYNFPPGVKPTANEINFITDSAQKAGGRAVYEVGTKEEADRLKLAGVKSVIYVPPKDGKPGITAPHFSFYSI